MTNIALKCRLLFKVDLHDNSNLHSNYCTSFTYVSSTRVMTYKKKLSVNDFAILFSSITDIHSIFLCFLLLTFGFLSTLTVYIMFLLSKSFRTNRIWQTTFFISMFLDLGQVSLLWPDIITFVF